MTRTFRNFRDTQSAHGLQSLAHRRQVFNLPIEIGDFRIDSLLYMTALLIHFNLQFPEQGDFLQGETQVLTAFYKSYSSDGFFRK